MLRRLLAVVLVLALAPFAAAHAAAAPTLAIYPFTENGTVPVAIGVAFADALGGEIASEGGVTVVHGDPGLARAQYQDDAKARGAEFFVSGAIAPIGSSYAVIEALVRTRTGLLVWSVSYQVASVAELKGQGALVRQALFEQLGHLSFPTPSATSVAKTMPLASSNAPAATAPAATALVPSPSTPTASPAPDVAIAMLGGTALASDRRYAVRALLEAIRKRGLRADATEPAPDIAGGDTQLCRATRAATIVDGTVDTTRITSVTVAPTTTAEVALHFFDCRAQAPAPKAYAASKTAPIGTDAIRAAADDAVAAYFGSPPPQTHL